MARRSLSIKAYIGLWVISIFLAFVVLVVAGHVEVSRLSRMRIQIFTDANAVDAGRLFEIALLNEQREDVLWLETREDVHLKSRRAEFSRMGLLVDDLTRLIDSPKEAELVGVIKRKFGAYRAVHNGGSSPLLAEEGRLREDLLSSLRDYRRLNDAHMERTFAAAENLSKSIRLWSIGLVAAIAVVLTAGSLGLMAKVFRPALELIRVAREFGRGNTKARAKVSSQDELGAACGTFNSMAENITNQEKTRLDFVAKIAHDLRNPLVTIGGAARMLRDNPGDAERLRAWLERIIREIARLEHLTHNLMDAAQVSTGRLSLNKSVFDLREVVESITSENEQLVGTHSLLFEGEGPCPILGDRERLERVVSNLISNAVKYSPEGTDVVLKVTPRQSHAAFTITDQGKGMSEEDVTSAFQIFSRRRLSGDLKKGMGLGLSIVKEIIEAHDGTINVKSQPGVGTTFEIVLPLADGPEQAPARP